MPRQLALCLFVAFIVWLLRRYRKEWGVMSPGLWAPLLWVGINASRPVGFWFASGTAAAEAPDVSDGNPINRNVYLALILIGMGVLVRRRIDWRTVFTKSRWLIIFYLYLLFSTLWSEFPFIAFKRWFKDAGDIVMVLIILTEKDPVEAVRGVFVRCAYVLIPLSVLFIKWFPETGRYFHQWTWETCYSGVTTNKNSLGLLAMMSGLFLLWQIVDGVKYAGRKRGWRRLWPEWLVLAMCVWLLRIAGSQTALFCFGLGAVLFLAARLPLAKANLRRIGWYLLGVALVMLAFTLSTEFRGAIAGLLGRNATLTERTVIWEKSLELKTNPLFGSGFFSTWISSRAAEFVDEYHLAHAHNGYLETYLHSGLIGVGLLLAVLVSAGRNATRQLLEGSVVGCLFVALFLSGLFYNYTEVAFNRGNVLGFFLWLLAAYGLAAGRSPRRVESSQTPKSQNLALSPECA